MNWPTFVSSVRIRMASGSRHRFLARSIHQVSFHNRLTEEDAMWRRREHELDDDDEEEKPRHRSRSTRRRSIDEEKSSKPLKKVKQTEGEFGPPLPTSLGVDADRWDHALFMQRYPEDYQKQLEQCRRSLSTSSDENPKKKIKKKHKKKKKKKKTHRQSHTSTSSESDESEHRKKSKRKHHRSKS